MIDAIIQARLGSTRLPGKILKKIDNKTLIEIMISRVIKSKKIKNLIICTTTKKLDDKIEGLCKKLKIKYFRGSEKNVMLRYIKCAKKFKTKHIVRLTSDCPFVDPKNIDGMISYYLKSKCDYLSNTCPPNVSTFPNGSDIEIFAAEKLSMIYQYEKRKKFREHVTLNFWQEKKYNSLLYKCSTDMSKYRYTLDYYDDLKVIKKIYQKFKKNISNVSTVNIVEYLMNNPDVMGYNDKYR